MCRAGVDGTVWYFVINRLFTCNLYESHGRGPLGTRGNPEFFSGVCESPKAIIVGWELRFPVYTKLFVFGVQPTFDSLDYT